MTRGNDKCLTLPIDRKKKDEREIFPFIGKVKAWKTFSRTFYLFFSFSRPSNLLHRLIFILCFWFVGKDFFGNVCQVSFYLLKSLYNAKIGRTCCRPVFVNAFFLIIVLFSPSFSKKERISVRKEQKKPSPSGFFFHKVPTNKGFIVFFCSISFSSGNFLPVIQYKP